MIIDCHCHAGRGTGLTGPWDTVARLDAFLRRAAAAGIARTVVFPVFHEDSQRANRELARIVAAHRGRLIGFGAVNARTSRARATEVIEEAVLRLGLWGLKVHRAEGRITRAICAAADRFRLPVVYDVMGKPGPIDIIAPEFRHVAFILPHLGSFSDDYRTHAQVIDLLVRHPNVFADTSGVRRFDYLVEAVRRAGPRKLLFGTDGPWLHPALELQKIKLLGLPAAAERRILGDNLRRLLARVRRRGAGALPPVDGLTART
jgi:uncharacterized protein